MNKEEQRNELDALCEEVVKKREHAATAQGHYENLLQQYPEVVAAKSAVQEIKTELKTTEDRLRNATAEAHESGVILPHGLRIRETTKLIYDEAAMFAWCKNYAPCFIQLDKVCFERALKAEAIHPPGAERTTKVTGTIPTALVIEENE